MPLDSTVPDDLVPIGGSPAPTAAVPPQQQSALPGDIMPIPKDIMPVGPAPTPPPPTDAGLLMAPIQGALRGSAEVGQTVGVAEGEKPQPLPEENTIASQPVSMADLWHPKNLAEKSLYQIGKSFPTLTAGIAGAAAGEVAGGPPGALAGGALAAGAATMVQSLGPEFARALKENPNNPDAAFNAAAQRAAASGVISGVGWRLFDLAPFSGAVKNMLFQAFGVQPAVTAAGRATQNVIEGRPAGEGVAEELPGAVIGTAIPMAGHAAAHAIARRFLPSAAPGPAGPGPGGQSGAPAGGAPGGGGGAAVPPDTMPLPGSTVDIAGVDQPMTVKGYRGDLVDLETSDGKPHMMTQTDFSRLHTMTQPAPAEATQQPAALPAPDVIYGPGRPWQSTGEGMIPGVPGFTMAREGAATNQQPAEPAQSPVTLDDIDRWAMEEHHAQAAGENPTPASQVTSPIEQAVEAATKPATDLLALPPPRRALPKPTTIYGEGFTAQPPAPLDAMGILKARMAASAPSEQSVGAPLAQPGAAPAQPRATTEQHGAPLAQPGTAGVTTPEPETTTETAPTTTATSPPAPIEVPTEPHEPGITVEQAPEVNPPTENEPRIIEGQHTKTKAPIVTVQLPQRVGSDEFKALGVKARELGGYYSAYRGNGAKPGFIFKTRDAAEKFAALARGEAPAAAASPAQPQPTTVRTTPTLPLDHPGLVIHEPRTGQTTLLKPKQDWTEIGKNQIGQTVYEDQNGVRSYIENGIRHTEPVGLKPGPGGLQPVVTPPGEKDLEYQVSEPSPAAQPGTGYVLPSFVTAGLRGEVPPPAAMPHLALADMIARALEQSEPISSRELQGYAEHAFGGRLTEGKFTRADMYDAMELGVNRYVEAHPELFDPNADITKAKETVARLEDLKSRLPTETVRAGEKEAFQQFSTPPDYAYTAAWLSAIRPEDSVLEPSAGTGSLVAAAHNAGPRELITNELSANRAPLVESLNPDRSFRENAEQLDNVLPSDVKPSVVIMNPPFSATAGRMGDKMVLMTGARHVEQALQRLEPGGRLVAIVGQGMRPYEPGIVPGRRGEPTGSTFRDWWRRISQNYDVRANIGIPGSIYGKYGTTFGTRLLVIDKTAPSDREPVVGEAASLPNAMEMLDEVRQDRPRVTSQPVAAEPGGEAVAGPSPPPNEPGPSIPRPVPVGGVRGEPAIGGAGAEVPGGLGPRGGAAVGPEPRPGGSNEVANQQPERPGPIGAEPNTPAGIGAGEIVGGGGAEPNGMVLRPEGGAGPVLPAGGEPQDIAEGPAPVPIQVDEAVAEPHAGGEITESVYEPYRPQRIKIAGAKPHPGDLVQSAAMASVMPPVVDYVPRLPKELISTGALSQAQLEPIVYAGYAHSQMLPEMNAGEPTLAPGWKSIGKNEFGASIRRGPNGEEGLAREGDIPKGWVRIGTNPDGHAIFENEYRDRAITRRGYFIGDGTGVGKGRQIAGIILDNVQQGRTKAVWISENKTLLKDAQRDWTGLGQNPKDIFEVGKTKAGEDLKPSRGIAFLPYDTLKSAERTGKDAEGKTIKGRRRLDQLATWLGRDFDGVIAFDEAHNLANSIQVRGARGVKDAAQKALAGIELQKMLPNARIVYVSATGATEVSNLAYADRLGLWGRGTPFPNKQEFINQIGRGGIAAMELVARDMKAMGHYVARNLSYDDVKYDRLEHNLSPQQKDVYDGLADGWQHVLANINEALLLTGPPNEHTGEPQADSQQKKNALSAFWGSHQRFFNQIITSMQMPSVLRAIEGDIKEGRQAVLQLVNTNEASQTRAIAKRAAQEGAGEDLYEDLDLTPRDQLMQMIDKSFPTAQIEEYVDENGNERTREARDAAGNIIHNKQALALKEALLDRVGSIRVPDGPLEMVLNHFGVDNVAEITGRGQRVVRKPDKSGTVRAQLETRPSSANENETNAFQNAKKKVLVFSQAGGTGRSYHAEIGTPSADAQRSHYLIQAGWRADKAIQGFGRTHRTNQASAPIFHLVTTDLQGQRRFISSIARRLSQLGALTKGERRAGESGLFGPKDNLESREADTALSAFWRDLQYRRIEGIDPRDFEEQTGLALENKKGEPTDPPEITQFLNRLLSLKFDMQNQVFGEFERRLNDAVDSAAAAGTLDVGAETYKADRIRKDTEQTVYTDPKSGAETKYVRLVADHRNNPATFDQVNNGRHRVTSHTEPLFYAESHRSGKVVAVTEGGNHTDTRTGDVTPQFRLADPLRWDYVPRSRLDDDRLWQKIEDRGQAKQLWDKQVSAIPEYRSEDVHLITGAVLPIWDRLSGYPKVYRLQTDAGERMLGRVVDDGQIGSVLKALGAESAAKEFTPEQVADRVLDGDQATLVNGWKLKRSMVAGEPRIELTGPYYSHDAELAANGLFKERIQYDTRYFVPTGDDAPKVLARLLAEHPIAEMATASRGLAEEVPRGWGSVDTEVPFEKPTREEFNRTPALHRGEVITFTPALGDLIAHQRVTGIADPHAAIRDWVMRRGGETDHEYYGAISGTKGIVDAGTSHQHQVVKFSDRLVNHLMQAGDPVDVHHNHPSAQSLSSPDLAVLASPNARWIVAHTSDGFISAARLTLQAAEWLHGMPYADAAKTMQWLSLSASEAGDNMIGRIAKLGVPRKKLDQFYRETVNRALAAAGVIDYMGTRPMPGWTRSPIERGAQAIAGELPWNPTRDDINDRIHRSAGQVLGHAAAMAGFSQPDAETAAGRPTGANGSAAGAEGNREAAEPRQAALAAAGLAEERPRDFSDRATEEAINQAMGPTGANPPGNWFSRLQDDLGAKPGTPAGDHKDFAVTQKMWTLPSTKGSTDPLSNPKWLAELAKKRDATAFLNQYKQGLASWRGKPMEQWRKVFSALELLTLDGAEVPTDGRAIIVENRDRPLAALSKPGEIIRIEQPDEIQMLGDYLRTMDQVWQNLVGETARQFGWTGTPTSKAINEAAAKAQTPGLAKSLQRAARIVAAIEYQHRNSYLPLMRRGDYFIRVTPRAGTADKPGIPGWTGDGYPPTTLFKLIDSRTPLERAIGGMRSGTPKTAQAEIDALRQQFPEDEYDIDHGYMFAKTNALRDMDIPAIDKLMMLVGNDARGQIADRLRHTGMGADEARSAAQDDYDSLVDAVLDRIYEERVAGFKKPRSGVPGYCVAPETNILTADLRMVRAASVSVGDELVGFEEYPQFKCRNKMLVSVVESVTRLEKTCHKITLLSGRSITVSDDHKLLARTAQGNNRWCEARELRIGDAVKIFPWDAPRRDFDAGWLSGFVDGEGHFSSKKPDDRRSLMEAGWCQKPGALFERSVKIAQDAGLHVTVSRPAKDGRVHGASLRTWDSLRLLQIFRPERLIASKNWVGAPLPTQYQDEDEDGDALPRNGNGQLIPGDVVVKLEYMGMIPVIGISTTSKTFIAEGMCSHNSSDFGRATSDYLHWLASYTSDLRHRPALERGNAIIAQHPDPRTRAFWRDFDRRQEDYGDELHGPLMHIRQGAFYWLLGMNAASTAKIALHGPLLGIPTMTTGLGALGGARAAGDYLAAAGSILKGMRIGLNGIEADITKAARTPEERALLADSEAKGITHPQTADELSAMRGRGEAAMTPQQSLVRRVLDAWGSNISAADRMIRASMLLAAHRTATRLGMDAINRVWDRDLNWRNMPANVQARKLADQIKDPKNRAQLPTLRKQLAEVHANLAAAWAQFMVDRTAGIWGDINRLPLLRSQLGGMMGQFRTYEINYLSTMWQLMSRMGPAGKVSAAIMLGGMGMLGGAVALPFFQDAEAAANWLYKTIMGIDPDLEGSLKRAMDAMVPGVGEDILHGAVRPVLGTDVGSIGFGDIASRNMESPLDLFGAGISMPLTALSRANERYQTGQEPLAVARELMPSAVKNLISGMYPETELASSAHGTMAMAPSQLSTADQVKMGLGFRPAAPAQHYEQVQQEMHRASAFKAALATGEDRVANLMARGINPKDAIIDLERRIAQGEREGVLPANEMAEVKGALRARILQRIHPEIPSKSLQRYQAAHAQP